MTLSPALHRDEWIGSAANPSYVAAAREAQSRLQRWTYAELVNNSRRLTSSSETSPNASGGSRVEDNAVILQHVERGSPHVEMWKLHVGDYGGERVHALWSVTMPGERDFWLYMLDPGPIPTEQEHTGPLDPTMEAEQLQQLLAAIASGRAGPGMPFA